MKIYFPGNKKVYAEYKGFTIQTDQPKKAGGDGSAPSPFDLFLASLGTCAGLYVLGFCQQRNIDTSDISLTLATERNDQTDLISHINIVVSLPDDFPPQYESAIIKSASLCAVKKHLQDPPLIDISTTHHD